MSATPLIFDRAGRAIYMNPSVRKTGVIIALLLAATVLVLAVTGSPWRSYEATRLLLDLSKLGSPVSEHRELPLMRASLTYEVNNRSYSADIYRPLEEPSAGLILLHGAAPTGKDDPRLVNLAAILARARFVVLLPDLVRLRKLQLRASATQEIADAIRYMVSSPSLTPNGTVGIAAISVAAGPAIRAALKPEARERVRFILAIGGYYDLLTTLTFSTTGYFLDEGRWRWQEPNELGKWVFVLSNIEELTNRTDREIFEAIADRKRRNEPIEIEGFVSRLSPEGLAIHRFITNTDPEQATTLFAQLPPKVKYEVRALSPSKGDLSQMQAQVILVHGLDDPIVPYTESIQLARALGPHQSKLVLIKGLVHAHLKPSLLDHWRLWRAVYAVLAARDR